MQMKQNAANYMEMFVQTFYIKRQERDNWGFRWIDQRQSST